LHVERWRPLRNSAMNRLPLVFGCLGVLTGLSLAAVPQLRTPKPTPVKPEAVDFRRDIQPILAARCYSCHGHGKQQGGLRLDDRAAALKGGNSGQIIVPGKSADSRLYRVVAGLDREIKMPPTGKRLTGEEIQRLRAWIDQGAVWQADAEKTQAVMGSTHWAF